MDQIIVGVGLGVAIVAAGVLVWALLSIRTRTAELQRERFRLEAERARSSADPATEVTGRTPRLEVVEPRCDRCRWWDLEEGQAVMAQHPHFLAAARFVTPAEMGRHAVDGPEESCADCKGSGSVGTGRYSPEDGELMETCETCDGRGCISSQQLSPPSAPFKAQWSQFGACSCPALLDEYGAGECRWAGDSCEHFDVPEIRLTHRGAAK